MSDEKILQIQEKLYELIEYFDGFCKKHDIVYYLCGGNAIGAMRHEGPIPWDDDFDVYLTKENYDKFIMVASENLDTEKFYLQKENTKEWPLFFSKLRMNGTTYHEEDTKDRNMHKGFYIDIFCLYDMPSNKILQYVKYISARFLVIRSLADKGYIKAGFLVKVLMLISKIVVPSFVKKILISIVNANVDKPNSVADLFGFGKLANLNLVCFPCGWCGKARLVKYGHLKLPVFEEIEKYLTHTYGDYLAMPDEATKQKYKSHVVFFDTMVDYRIYDER